MDMTLHDTLILLRLQLRLVSRRRGGGRVGGGSGRRGLPVWVVALIVLAIVVPLALSLSALLSAAVSSADARVLLAPLLSWLSSVVTLVLFLFAVPAVLATFTYNSDLKLLLLTPLSPRLILSEKLIAMCGGFLGLLLVIGLPLLLSIGQAAGLGPAYFILAVVVLVLLPVAPLSLVMLITVGVLRWVPPARARSITAVLGALFAIAYYLGQQILVGRHTSSSIQTLVQGSHAWWSNLPTTWPGQALAAAGLDDAGGAVAYLAATLILSLALSIVAIGVSAHLFATGWATYQEVGRRSRKPRLPATEVATVTTAGMPGTTIVSGDGHIGSPAARAMATAAGASLSQAQIASTIGRERDMAWILALAGKDWTTLRRDPQIWARLLYPLFVIGFGLYRTFTTGSLTGAGSTASASRSAQLNLFFGLLTFLAFFLAVFLALPTINREGRALPLLTLSPLSPRQILAAKWAYCSVLALILLEVLVIIGSIVLNATPATVLLAMLSFGLLSISLAGLLLFISLVWPRLDWDNPRRQVSTPASLIGSLAALAVSGVTTFLLIHTLGLSGGDTLGGILSILGIVVLNGGAALVVTALAPARLDALMHGER